MAWSSLVAPTRGATKPELQTFYGHVVDLRRHVNVHLHHLRPFAPTDRYELWLRAPDGAERKFTLHTRELPARRGHELSLVTSGLVQHWPGGAASLRAVVAEDQDPDEGALAHAAWAEKSCRIMATEGFYPAGHKLDAGYGQRWSKTLVQQMAAAARRLAAALNRSLGGP